MPTEDLTTSHIRRQLHPIPSSEQESARMIADRYEVVQTMTGGMAIVYLCRDHETGQLVALKTFKPEYLPNREARDLFLREGTMWVDIGPHPHVVRAYRVERVGDGLEVYLVLEWVVQPEGKAKPSLRAWLQPGKPLPLRQAITFALHIARGMKRSAERIPGMVHRDLKPENILVGHDHNARITDFGLASTLSLLVNRDTGRFRLPQYEKDIRRTQLSFGAAGTPLYMAPEQWERLNLDARADIYALGCIVYEMVTGRLAARGKTREALQQIHVNGRIQPPPATLPPELITFLRRCMMVDRAQRYGTWTEVEKAIESLFWYVLKEPPPEERKTTAPTREERLVSAQSYNSMGLSYIDIGKLNVAIMYFEQAVWTGREEDSKSLEGAGLGNLGRAYMRLGYRQRAIEFYEEQLAIARELGDLSQEGEALGNLGQAYQQIQDLERAVTYHERELHIAQEINNSFREAAALNNLGDTYWRIGDTERAVLYYKQSLALARQIEDRARVKSILSSMGQAYLESGEVKEAVALLHQALNLARRIGDRVGEGVSLGDLGLLYQDLGYQERAIKFYKKAIQIARESDDRRHESRHLTSLGDIYMTNGDLATAQSFFQQALTAAQVIGDQVQELRLWHRLGDIYLAQNHPIKAASLLKKALDRSRHMSNPKWIRKSLRGLGTAYQNWGDSSRAILYFGQYLDLLDWETEWEETRETWHTIGRLYRKAQQYQKTYQTYQTFLEQAKAHGDEEAAAEAQIQIGDVYRRVEEAKKAVEAYKDALALARERGDREREAKALSGLGLAYYDMGRNWHSGRNLDKAVEQAEKTGDEALIAMTRYKLALVLYKQKKWSKALPHARMAQELFQKLEANDMLNRVQVMLAAIDEQTERSTGFLLP